LYAKAAAVTAGLLLIVGGGLYVVTKNVWFLGTNDEGVITLYRGLPYECQGFQRCRCRPTGASASSTTSSARAVMRST
jgi:hypothetical protein